MPVWTRYLFAVMIVCNGIVGACLLFGAVRHHEQEFQLQGATAALAVLTALTGLTLILPNFAISVPGPVFSTSQLVFAGLVSLVLYGSFVFVQTIRHREYFLPVKGEDAHALRVRPNTSSRITEFSEHEADGSEFQESDGSAVEIFPVLGEPAAAIEPRNRTFYDPTLG